MTIFGFRSRVPPPPTSLSARGRVPNGPPCTTSTVTDTRNDMTMLSTSSLSATPASTSISISSTASGSRTSRVSNASALSSHSLLLDEQGHNSMTTLVYILNVMMSKGRTPLTRVRKWNQQSGVQVISGKNIQQFLLDQRFVRTEKQAYEIGHQLIRISGLIPTFHVKTRNDSFIVSPSKEYVHRGLTNLQEKGLNYTISNPSKVRFLIDILFDFNVAFKKLCHLSLTDDGCIAITYWKLQSFIPFRELLLLLSEMEYCKLGNFKNVPDYIKITCWVNVFNFLNIHSVLVFGYPCDVKERTRLFQTAGYTIANKKVTIDQMQNILRRKSMAFRELQPRQFDARVNLLMSNGALSSPALLPMTLSPSTAAPSNNSTVASHISNASDETSDSDREGRELYERQVKQAVQQFINVNVHFDDAKRIVKLNRLFKWYVDDFAPGAEQSRDDELLSWIARYAGEQQSIKVFSAMRAEPRYSLVFDDYNWASEGENGSRPDTKNTRKYDEYFSQTV